MEPNNAVNKPLKVNQFIYFQIHFTDRTGDNANCGTHSQKVDYLIDKKNNEHNKYVDMQYAYNALDIARNRYGSIVHLRMA